MTNEYIVPVARYNRAKVEYDTITFNREGLLNFLVNNVVKKVGEYRFNPILHDIVLKARRTFEKNGYYINAPFKSIDYINFWDSEKQKCRNGLLVIIDDDDIVGSGISHKYYYFTREYYFWLNFLKIFNKEFKRHTFPEIRDFQYELALLELIAELQNKHVAILKVRQCASSYFHTAKLLNHLWFEEGVVLKICSFDETWIRQDWAYLKEYKDFLNTFTGWYRAFNPEQYREWEQRYEVRTPDGRKIWKGNKSRLTAHVLQQGQNKEVGGHSRYIFFEEAGIAKGLLEVKAFVEPALMEGDILTGQAIFAGSVGNLEAAEDLKDMIYNPDKHNVFSTKTIYYDDSGNERLCGIFIPVQYGFKPYIDEYGNSDVQGALEALKEEIAKEKKRLDYNLFQIRRSQRPRYIEEAFAWRKESIFPLALIKAQKQRIQEGKYHFEYIELEEVDGKIIPKNSNRPPINVVPIPTTLEDKRGCLCVLERPDNNLPFGTYVASIDPVAIGKTSTSSSLAAIYVYRIPSEKRVIEGSSINNEIEGDRIVAFWTGRYDDLNDTNRMLEYIVRWYNARAIVENNQWTFIQHMISRRLTKHLVPSTEIMFLKEISANSRNFRAYGYTMTHNLFRGNLIPYLIEYMKEELWKEYDDNGNEIRTVYGIERIPDILALEEMERFEQLDNYDRLVALSSLVAYVRILTSNYGYVKYTVIENKEKKKNNDIERWLKYNDNIVKLNRNKSYFRYLR